MQKELNTFDWPDMSMILPLCVWDVRQRWNLMPVFAPIWLNDGKLMAVEMLSRVYSENTMKRECVETFFQQSEAEVQQYIFQWQLEIVKVLRPWCEYYKVMISVNITRSLAHLLVEDMALQKELSGLSPWIRLEVSEHLLDAGDLPGEVFLIQALHSLGGLWPDDLSINNTSLAWLVSGLVDTVKLDYRLFQMLFSISEGKGFLLNVVTLAKRMNISIIAEGIETPELWEMARDVGITACQGWLWPEVTVNELKTLQSGFPFHTINYNRQ